MKDHQRTIVLDAARRIDAAAQKLGAAYRDLSEDLAQAGREAYQEAGKSAVEDLTAVIGQGRQAEEVAGLLVAVGLSDVLRRERGAEPVADFFPRWKARLDRLPASSSRSAGAPSHAYATPGQTPRPKGTPTPPKMPTSLGAQSDA